MKAAVEINNAPANPCKYIVARMNNGELWYWGSWDEPEKAEEAKGGFDNAIVAEVMK